MRSFRSKPVGWRNDSYRHYLAQKGVKTKHKYFMPFIQEEVEFVGSGEEKIGPKKTIMMEPDEFMRHTRRQDIKDNYDHRHFRHARELAEMSDKEYEDFLKANEEIEVGKLKSIEQGLSEGKDVPGLALVFEEGSDVPVGHEGRHRALVAKQRGETVPVDIFEIRAKNAYLAQKDDLGWRGKLVKYQYEREKAVEQEIADLKLRHEKEVMRGNVREAELLDARIAEREDERRVRAERFVNHAVWIGEKSPSEYEEVGREIEEEEEMK